MIWPLSTENGRHEAAQRVGLTESRFATLDQVVAWSPMRGMSSRQVGTVWH